MHLLAVTIVSFASGCTGRSQDFGIRLEDLEAARTNSGISVSAQQEIVFSAEARRALQHGVPLRIRIDVALKGGAGWSGGTDESLVYEIRYLPLSDHYQLSGPGNESPARTYPRLRHVLAALGRIDLSVPATQRTEDRLEVRMRSRLDHSGMPGPMQLPVYLSQQWKHDSGWVAAQVPAQGMVGG